VKDEEVIDGLKRWLEHKDTTFLEWLEEDSDFKMECHSSIELEALQATLARYEKDMSRMRKKLLTEEELLQHETAQVDESTIELSERLERLMEERDDQFKEVTRLETLIEDLKVQFKKSLEGVSQDKSSLIMKEMELHELESRLSTHLKALETQATGANVKVVKNMEKGFSDRFRAEIKEKEEQWRQKEAELRGHIARLEKELTGVTVDLRISDEQLKMGDLDSPEAASEIEMKLARLQSQEKESLLMKVQLENVKADMSVREEEVNRLREAINNKEEEMARREEELQYKDKVLTAERIRFEESKKEIVGVGQVEMRKKLEDLGNEIKTKEEELRNKEKWLNAKADDIRRRESGVIEDEINTRQKEQILEFQQAKAKTGINRLDDLLYGGIPFGSNIMIHGPPFVGKEVMVNVFIADGLKKGIPALWVITDKTARDIRDEMRNVLSGYEEYEKKGLVKYIDSYSRSMGDDSQDPYTTYIDDPTDHQRLTENVDSVCREFKEKSKYYRMAFRSVSTLIAYSDPNAAFRTISPICGRRKKDGAVSMLMVEKGMHGEQEIQMLGSIMDGMIDFKVDQMKTFFSVQGIADVQSRAYIRYTATKHNLNIGSFALDHIR
jgi:KaiC/GvpD/RAD55 family RecA-like ATPase